MSAPPSGRLTVAGLFAGIGGIELGLHRAGHRAELLCEIDEGARHVLRAHFPNVPLADDVRTLERLPAVDLLAAGFPCQDLSQAGRTNGIDGRHSGLVDHVFRLLRDEHLDPRWVLLENVPFMLRLERGRGMRFLTRSLEELGYSWAYRVVDTRAFGLPQRRQRVLLLASRREDPRGVLYADDAGQGPEPAAGAACGFYWTEGLRGLGWAPDALPTLKGGSTIGIPSSPAIWLRDRDLIVTPDVRDAERLQGFPTDWTAPAGVVRRGLGHRWKLVGNAVSVPVAEWVGRRLAGPGTYDGAADAPLAEGAPWPRAAWNTGAGPRTAPVSMWPVKAPYRSLAPFLEHPTVPLSFRAIRGFRARAREGSLRFDPEFLAAVERHFERMALGQVELVGSP